MAGIAWDRSRVLPVGARTDAPRQTATVRVTHWITALGFVALQPQSDFEAAVRERDRAADRRLQALVRRRIKGWTLSVNGLVAHPASLSLDDVKRLPVRSQITQVACEEGWSYVAEWTGTPLVEVLNAVGILPQARYLVYFSIQPGWWESIDMADALHPQTLVTYGMNDGDLPAPFGGPLRLRVPRQLGYKSVKYVTRVTLTDSLKAFNGTGSANADGGYAWYAGI